MLKKVASLLIIYFILNSCAYKKAKRLLNSECIKSENVTSNTYGDDNEYIGETDSIQQLHLLKSNSSISFNNTFPEGFEKLAFNDGDTERSKREQAKTTYVLKPKLTFNTVKEFLIFLKQNNASDDIMKELDINNKSPRLPKESIFITIKLAYLYSFSIEEDNDIHLIFGDNKTSVNQSTTMNGEISGLPVLFKKDAKQITDVRKKAIKQLEKYKKCTGTSQAPLFIPIKISGSIFYDSGHKSKHAKCGCCSASGTAWEIHPIYSFDILE